MLEKPQQCLQAYGFLFSQLSASQKMVIIKSFWQNWQVEQARAFVLRQNRKQKTIFDGENNGTYSRKWLKTTKFREY